MTDLDSGRLIERAVAAFESGDLQRTLALASSAARQDDDPLRPLALFWMGMGHAGLHHHDQAAELWRSVRDDPRADAAQPLLSLQAAANLARIPEANDPRSADERRALARHLADTLLVDTEGLEAMTADIASDHLKVLSVYNDALEAAALAAAILTVSEARADLWSSTSLAEIRVTALIANLDLADEHAAQVQAAALSAGGLETLPTLNAWAQRLDSLGSEAAGHLVLLAACIRLDVLVELGRTAEATSVYEAAQRTQAARDPQYKPLVNQLHDIFAREPS